ncbi:Protein of unknown function [Cotesia congregata]|uniref:Uncharacterized protein n=1 Tax=Cotesia congregata TaxID=51543 RepID=A0A8J2HDC8_COTCN|nr:Protein of unknown function [Cotesia congregata]
MYPNPTSLARDRDRHRHGTHTWYGTYTHMDTSTSCVFVAQKRDSPTFRQRNKEKKQLARLCYVLFVEDAMPRVGRLVKEGEAGITGNVRLGEDDLSSLVVVGGSMAVCRMAVQAVVCSKIQSPVHSTTETRHRHGHTPAPVNPRT